jgi:hypothetical protein
MEGDRFDKTQIINKKANSYRDYKTWGTKACKERKKRGREKKKTKRRRRYINLRYHYEQNRKHGTYWRGKFLR